MKQSIWKFWVPGCPSPCQAQRREPESGQKVQGGGIVRECRAKFPDKRIWPGKCLQKSEFPPVGGQQAGRGSRQPPGGDILELFTPVQTRDLGRMPDDFRWCIDNTLNHTESHSEKIISLSVSFFSSFLSRTLGSRN